MAKKVASRPIPETSYFRFKSRLEEMSSKWNVERNLTLFMLGIATGYRLQDLTDLTILQIRQALDDGCFLIQEKKQYRSWETATKNNPKSKSKKPSVRRHDIEPPLEAILKKYIRGKRNSEFAFPSQKKKTGCAISPKSYSEILTKVGKSLGLKNISGHSLRKTYACRLWEATGNLEYVRIALGHKSIEITRRYLGLDDEIKIEAAKIAAKRL